MTNVCCTDCRLRFAPAASAHLPACPECGGVLTPFGSAGSVLGFQLHTSEGAPDSWLTAIAVALPVPDLRGTR